jgi:ribosomal protein L21E
VIGARRAGTQRETLTLDFGKQSCDVPNAMWSKYKDGDKVKVKVIASTGKLVWDSL